MSFNPNILMAEIARSGVLRNNKFLVQFPMPLSLRLDPDFQQLADTNRVMELYCEASNLPGVALLTSEIRRYGYGPNEKKPFSPIFTDVSMVFRGDANGRMWRFLHSWMMTAINYQYKTGMTTRAPGQIGLYPGEVGYKYDPANGEGYATDVNIQVFDDSGGEAIRVVLREAYPVFVGDIPLNWAARGDYMRIPVTLTFFDWFAEPTVENP